MASAPPKADPIEVLVKNYEKLEPFEAAIRERPYSVDAWVDYLQTAPEDLLTWIGQRALKLLPRSYKLWKMHWEHIADNDRDSLIVCLERAIVTLGAYPRVWNVYFDFLTENSDCCSVTHIRRTINKSLQSVPVAMHDKLWPAILILLKDLPLETQAALRSRYSTFQPSYLPEHAEWLREKQMYGPAAKALQDWYHEQPNPDTMQALLELVTSHPNDVNGIVPWESMIQAQLQQHKDSRNKKKEPDQKSHLIPQGVLWTSWATALVRQGLWDQARTIYAQGLEEVSTVRDFGIVYQAYLALEEGLVEAAVNDMDNEEEMAEPESQEDDDDWDLLLSQQHDLSNVEMAIARAEHLTARRPLLLNAVLLRQEPNHVAEWLNRANLLEGTAAVATLQKALETIRPAYRAVHGKPHEIVCKLASLYEQQSFEQAHDFLHGVCVEESYPFGKKRDDLAACWAAWVDLQVRYERWDDALGLARQAVSQIRHSLLLWNLLLDLEEALGTLATTKDAYNQTLQTKVATVAHVLQFAEFLLDNDYFEESFTVYERGAEMFAFPHGGAKLIWMAYLEAFANRYKGSKVERSRDLFQRCLSDCPAEEAVPFYLLWGAFEEKHGLTRRALGVYREMTRKLTDEQELLVAYQLYIAKTAQYLGLTATRAIYEQATQQCKDHAAAQLCMDFANMEANLLEYDRARGIYAFGAPMANPLKLPEFYKCWNDFEIAHGNEETFREMLRIKRSVEASFSTINYTAMQEDAAPTLTDEQAMQMIARGEGDDLETGGSGGFVRSSKEGESKPSSAKKRTVASLDDVEAQVAKLRKVTAASASSPAENNSDEDDDEIDIDDIDAEIEAAAAEGSQTDEPSTKTVPAAVFGDLAASTKQ